MTKKLTRAKLLVGTADSRSDLRYATGFSAPDFVVYVQRARMRHLLVPPLEYGRAVKEARKVRVISTEEIGLTRTERGKFSAWVIKFLEHLGISSVEVPWSFPALLVSELERAEIRVFINKDKLFPERAVKTAEEIGHIREVQQAAVIAMRAAVRELQMAEEDNQGILKKGSRRLDADGIRSIIDHQLLERKCTARDTIVACGPESADPHARGSGWIRAGEPIVIDIFPQHNVHGYWGDLTRTVIKGRVSPELIKMYRAVKAAQKAGLEAVKPRVEAQTVHHAVQSVFDKRGFKTSLQVGVPQGFIHGTGHGVGLDIHEAPSVSRNKNVLRKGNVITVEPGLYYTDIGGIRIEDTILVTATGWQYLYPCEKIFQL